MSAVLWYLRKYNTTHCKTSHVCTITHPVEITLSLQYTAYTVCSYIEGFKSLYIWKVFTNGGGAQWANLGGQTLQVKWLVNCKDPMHDCNRFLWQILHTTGEHWTDISKCIYWMLNPRRWTHQITKYWRWTIQHLYWSAIQWWKGK